jgi:hypothetical protein
MKRISGPDGGAVYGAARVSQAGDLRGISGIGSGRLFIVKPYGLTGFSHFPASAAGTGLAPGTNALYTGGVDVKLGLRSNLVANLTVNTDFANAEVDTQQFNLTPYKLFFPEKRQFFLENAGVFNFPLGDGRLNYGREVVSETYYNAHVVSNLYMAVQLSYINNPGYNRDRGPVIVPGVRAHVDF